MSNEPKRMNRSPRGTTTQNNEANTPAIEISPTLTPTREAKRELVCSLWSTKSVNLNQHGVVFRNHEAQEYSCKYCPKKFTNKQSLGGHQNAHRIERDMDRNIQKNNNSNIGYIGGSSGPRMSSPRFLDPSYISFNQTQISTQHDPNLILPGRPYQSTDPTMKNPFALEPEELNPGYMEWQPMSESLVFIASPPENENQGAKDLNSAACSLKSIRKREGESSSLNNHSENQQPQESELDLTLKL